LSYGSKEGGYDMGCVVLSRWFGRTPDISHGLPDSRIRLTSQMAKAVVAALTSIGVL